jgi:predicted lipoprotein with Yx(FWY)xxD motif
MRLIPIRARAILPAIAAGALILSACQNAGTGSSGPSTGGGPVDLAVSHTAAGDALSGAGGMTLYILTDDHDGNSSCTDSTCTVTWPPLLGDGSLVNAGSGVSGTFGTTTRPDGNKQVTHNGQPLYYYSGDSAPGDSKGQGTNNTWFIAPVGTAVVQASGNANPSATPYRAPGY